MVAPLMVTLVLGSAVLGTASPAAAAPAYPRADGRCVDTTGVLGPRLCAQVTRILRRDEARTSDEIAVAVVDDTGDASIERWSTGLFNAWGVGKKDKDNGVLLVVALDDRRLRLETGRGLAKRLSDAEAADIIETVITPRFADGAYAAGILAGLDRIRRQLGHPIGKDARLLGLAATAPERDEESVPDADEQTLIDDEGLIIEDGFSVEQDDVGGEGSPAGVLVLFVVAAGVLGLIGVVRANGSGRRDGRSSGEGWSSGSGHGTAWSSTSASSSSFPSSSGAGPDSSGDSGFGGGSSDGGGSSGSW